MRFLPPGLEQSSIQDRDLHIHRDTFVFVGSHSWQRNLGDVRYGAAHAHQAGGRIGQILLGALEPVGGIAAHLQAGQLRPAAERLRHQVFGIRRRAGRKGLVFELIGCGLLGTDGAGQLGVGALHLVLRLEQQQLGLRQVHIHEADVQFRAKLVIVERGNLVHEQLPRRHGLLRHLHQRLCAQRSVVGLVDAHQDVVPGGLSRLLGGAGLQPRAGDQVGRASGIRDQLAERDALAEAVEEAGVGQEARSDARPADCPASR